MIAKLALEEHFIPRGREELVTNPGWPEPAWRRVLDQLTDVDQRLEEMDRAGVEMSVLSLASNGIQDVLEPDQAVRLAREANDALAEIVAARPDRYQGFAALPMYDVDAAADELDRSVRTLGFRGALVNGYTAVKAPENGLYYDDPRYDRLWSDSSRSTSRCTCTRATRCPTSDGSTPAASSCSAPPGRSRRRPPSMRCG